MEFVADGVFGSGLALHASLVYFTRLMQLPAVVQAEHLSGAWEVNRERLRFDDIRSNSKLLTPHCAWEVNCERLRFDVIRSISTLSVPLGLGK